MIRMVIIIAAVLCLTPIVIFFCVKFGTVGYYKAKQFIEKEKEESN